VTWRPYIDIRDSASCFDLFWCSLSSDSFPILNLTTAFECHKFKTVWKFLVQAASVCFKDFQNNRMVDYHYEKFGAFMVSLQVLLRMKPLVNHSLNK
jgi:hypothetical protein